MSLCEGDTFDTYEAFIEALERYQAETKTQFSKRTSSTVASYKRKLSNKVLNERLKYAEMKWQCKSGGDYRPKGRGIRTNSR